MNLSENERYQRGHTVTYGIFLCDYRPFKSEPFRVRLTVGVDRLEYPEDVSSQSTYLLESTLIFNSTMSDARRGARFM